MGFLIKAVQVAVAVNKFTTVVGATIVVGLAIYNAIGRQRRR